MRNIPIISLNIHTAEKRGADYCRAAVLYALQDVTHKDCLMLSYSNRRRKEGKDAGAERQ